MIHHHWAALPCFKPQLQTALILLQSTSPLHPSSSPSPAVMLIIAVAATATLISCWTCHFSTSHLLHSLRLLFDTWADGRQHHSIHAYHASFLLILYHSIDTQCHRYLNILTWTSWVISLQLLNLGVFADIFPVSVNSHCSMMDSVCFVKTCNDNINKGYDKTKDTPMTNKKVGKEDISNMRTHKENV